MALKSRTDDFIIFEKCNLALCQEMGWVF